MKGNLKTSLRGKLTDKELDLIYKSYDVIGNIAVIRIPEQSVRYSEIIAEALLQQKNIDSVWRQSSPIYGDYRLRKLLWVAGERKSVTVHKEHGCLFKVDIEKCYFSPRLAFERIRIAQLVEDNDVVVNMFAGVGCYSIVIAKYSKASKIFSIDINPHAVRFMRENILLNKNVGRIFPLEGNANKIAKETLNGKADRVLMPLPQKAYDYLDYALLTVKPLGGWIHYYDFQHSKVGENPVEKAETKVAEKLTKQKVTFKLSFSRIVRQTGPNWYQIVVDIHVQG